MSELRPFVKFFKDEKAQIVLEELSRHPQDLALLVFIAFRARRTTVLNDGLKPGQALIGDFRRCGYKTERGYRTSKKRLAKLKIATFRATSKGTIAELEGTLLFDLNLEKNDDQKDEQTEKKRRASDGQATINKNDKNDKNDKKRGQAGRFAPPSLLEVQTHFATKKFPIYEAEKFFHYYSSNGWRVGKNMMRNWYSAAAGWSLRSSSKIPTRPTHSTEPDPRRREEPEPKMTPKQERQEEINELRKRISNSEAFLAIPVAKDREKQLVQENLAKLRVELAQIEKQPQGATIENTEAEA